MTNIVWGERTIAGIPCLVMSPKENPGPFPTILIYHGWSSNKCNQRFIGSILVNRGYQVIAPDAPGHGSRQSIDFNSKLSVHNFFWPTILQSVDESDALIPAIIDLPEVESSRICLAGISMGGMAASAIFPRHQGIKCFTGIITTGAWDSHLEKSKSPEPLGASTLAKIQKNNPRGRLEDMSCRPMLLLHGDQDPIVSIESQRTFFLELRDAYGQQGNRVTMKETNGLGHFIELDMVENWCDWLVSVL